MRWRNNTAKLVKRRNAANSAWEIIENYGADRRSDRRRRRRRRLHPRRGVDQHHAATACSSAPIRRPAPRCGGRPAAAAASPRVFGRTGAVVATAGDYTADKISDGGGKVMMTAAERTALAAITLRRPR